MEVARVPAEGVKQASRILGGGQRSRRTDLCKENAGG